MTENKAKYRSEIQQVRTTPYVPLPLKEGFFFVFITISVFSAGLFLPSFNTSVALAIVRYKSELEPCLVLDLALLGLQVTLAQCTHREML